MFIQLIKPNNYYYLYISFFVSGTKVKPKKINLLDLDEMNFQSHMTSKPTREIISKQNCELNWEISPDFTSSLESVPASSNNLILSENTPCLNTQEQSKSSLKPLSMQQIITVDEPLISEPNQSNTLSQNTSLFTDLHLSTIDWEGTSFSNSPAHPQNTLSPGLKSKLETPIPATFKNIQEQVSCHSQWDTTKSNEILHWKLQKTHPEDHLLSGITDLHLQDLQNLPLKERMHIKLTHSQDYVPPNIGLKILSTPNIKETYFASNRSDCQSDMSKAPLRIDLQKESKNSKILKGDHLFQEHCNVNTSRPYSVSNQKVKISSIGVEPPYTSLDHSEKEDVQTIERTITKKSVCLDRHSSDEESFPVFGKAKHTTRKSKQRSEEQNVNQCKESDANSLSNYEIDLKGTEHFIQAYKTAGNEDCSPDTAKSSLSSLQCHKGKNDPGNCLDSPLPLSERLKLRFQNI